MRRPNSCTARRVLCGEGPVEPTVAISHYLAAHPPTPDSPIELIFGVRRTKPPLANPLPSHLTVTSLMAGRGMRDIPNHHWPIPYSQICDEISSGTLRPDVVIASSTSMLPNGSRSLAGVNGYMQIAVDAASTVVLEEYPSLPHIAGSATTNRWDAVIPGPSMSESLAVSLAAEPGEQDFAIARHIADLVPAEAAVALGVGRVAEALTRLLCQRKNLTILTGAITSATRAIIDSGALLPTSTANAMSVIGDLDLLDWAASGPVSLLPSTLIHNASWLARNPRFTAVLGALQIDPAGNVNAHRAHGIDISGLGGAPDLAEGAHRSPGGLTIVALPSRSRDGASALVDSVEAVSIPGAFVDAVVTEQGAVTLAGADAAERRCLLATIFG